MDVSKHMERTGLEMYSLDGNVFFLSRLPDMMNICDADIAAIYKGWLMCLEKGWKNNLTDIVVLIKRILKVNQF